MDTACTVQAPHQAPCPCSKATRAGSYDRTCKVWDTFTGEELHTLEGHKNVVYAIAFNNPFGDKVATGSFDKTCKLWWGPCRAGGGLPGASGLAFVRCVCGW